MLENYPPVLNVKDVCEILSFSRSTVFKMLKNEEIKSFKDFNKNCIPKSEIINLLDRYESNDEEVRKYA